MNSNYWYLILGFLGLAILITTIILAFFIEATYIIPLIPASGTFMGLGFVGYFYRLSNPTKFRKEQVAEQDERLILIRGKAAYATFFVTLVLMAVVTYVSWILEVNVVSILLTGLIFIHILTFVIIYYIMNNKM